MLDDRSRYRQARAYVSEETGQHTLQKGERLDLLAREYYGDSRLWWRILDANPQVFFGGTATLDALAGRVILIPGGRE